MCFDAHFFRQEHYYNAAAYFDALLTFAAAQQQYGDMTYSTAP